MKTKGRTAHGYDLGELTEKLAKDEGLNALNALSKVPSSPHPATKKVPQIDWCRMWDDFGKRAD